MLREGASEIKETIRRIALANAIAHKGKARTESVLGKLLAENRELRKKIGEIGPIVEEIVEEVNSLALEKQRETAGEMWPELLAEEKEKIEEKKGLPPLPNVEKYTQVVTRFAPNPDCVLHIGSARAIVLCHEYARMYDGLFILRFEDTDPRLKKSTVEFYDLIREDLAWLGCKWDAEYIQSYRMELYYEWAEKLLEAGHAYVCTCGRYEFREKAVAKKSCACRNLRPKENLVRWEAMLNGEYDEGEAVVRIKTDLNHPNPAIREWPALRIIDTRKYPHPRTEGRYRVWPLFAFANGVDDHLNGITHVIRGKEHLTNQKRQEYLYSYLGWKYPEAIHYGRLKIEGAILSKSKIVRAVEDGTYDGWDDPRLATFRALRRRGISPEAIRRLMVDIGPRPVDITICWENLYAYNRKIIDHIADRFFFIQDPARLVVKGVKKELIANIPLHPDDSGRGTRILSVKTEEGRARFLVSGRDLRLLKERAFVRLMELLNIEVESAEDGEIVAESHSEAYEEARRMNAPLIHWLPAEGGVPCKVVMPDGSVLAGLAEDGCRQTSNGQIIQFERFGFVRVDEVDDEIVVFFAHK